MAKINIYDVEKIKNINEKRVWDLLVQFYETHSEYCTCRDCILDVVSITLNTIPPHYQVSDDPAPAIKKISDEDILKTIKEAADRVAKYPHHI
ncbi:competence protein ComFB [Deferribacter autotrophicus]|uniref:Competence protein ComFB n=1 Tax=Deferribacter autotrophicus TaxID=500465 RepID=A0A5A8F4X8_9BACT|nr:late competence development ComFB family protein [Deferribacter autotrophicus]KAA0257712.1 competence protein ComFB [Deferribacter autotrophicus]